MTKIIEPLATAEERRAALATLTSYMTAQAALADRLCRLLETFDDPLAVRETWESLIDEVMTKRRHIADRIEELRLQLGIAGKPDRVH